ncbi:MAG: cyclic 2,3-diphosphoglycerate synthase [Actinobacteria bacterium]|nr:cyclic 2,3-diphosphoglycerate synthase [Actinomycetota bacterium]
MRRVVIMGAAGRDFHNFNVAFRTDPEVEVVAFTATQIPYIAGRHYPPALSGPLYPNGIPIVDESELPLLLRENSVDEVIFAYSDVSHGHVMHAASTALALGADFRLMGPRTTMIEASVPVVSICATRTGSGKSQTTRRVAGILEDAGKKIAVVRHPMPYGDLTNQIVQRFDSFDDLARADCTIEEREEYEPHIRENRLVFAGIDYGAILEQAEKEAEVVVWDGGNNDTPFYRPQVHIVVTDPLRAGHETQYHPGEANLKMADVVVINKVDSASPEQIAQVLSSIEKANPIATVVKAESLVTAEDSDQIAGKRVLVIEDGPTLTHGEMSYGAGVVAAKRFGAAEIIDPRQFATASIREVYEKYEVGPVIPAMGYSSEQRQDLEKTINSAGSDLVLIATPIDLRKLIEIDAPALKVSYELSEVGRPNLSDALAEILKT